jgi:hypothetical protein
MATPSLLTRGRGEGPGAAGKGVTPLADALGDAVSILDEGFLPRPNASAVPHAAHVGAFIGLNESH